MVELAHPEASAGNREQWIQEETEVLGEKGGSVGQDTRRWNDAEEML